MWFKVDDGLAFHRKTVAAGNAAMGLWVRAGSWAAQHLTDGHVPDEIVLALGTRAQRDRLVRVGFWEPTDTGVYFHDWLTDDSGAKRQPTRAEVNDTRKRNRERQAEHRARKAAERARDRLNEPPPEAEPEPDPEVYAPQTQTKLPRVTSFPYVNIATPVTPGPNGVISTDVQVNGASHSGVTRDQAVSHSPVTLPRPDPTRLSTSSGAVSSGGPRTERARAGVAAEAQTAAERVAERYGPPVKARALPLVQAWAAGQPGKVPSKVRADLTLQVSQLLDDGFTAEQVTDAIALWSTKGLGAGVLPSVLHELQNGGGRRNGVPQQRQRPTADQRVQAVADWAATNLGADVFSVLPTTPALEGPPDVDR